MPVVAWSGTAAFLRIMAEDGRKRVQRLAPGGLPESVHTKERLQLLLLHLI